MMHMQTFISVQFHAIWFVKLPYLLPQPNWVAVRSRKKHSLPFYFHLFGLFWAHQSNGHQHLEKIKGYSLSDRRMIIFQNVTTDF